MNVKPKHAIGIASLGPPSEGPLGQTFLAEPKALAVIREYPDRRSLLTSEHEHAPIQRFGLEHFSTKPSQTVDATSKVDGLDCHEDSYVR
jgi:hypothetical protein